MTTNNPTISTPCLVPKPTGPCGNPIEPGTSRCVDCGPAYDAYLTELVAELRKFARGEAPYDRVPELDPKVAPRTRRLLGMDAADTAAVAASITTTGSFPDDLDPDAERSRCVRDGRPIARRTHRPNAMWFHVDERGGMHCDNGQVATPDVTHDQAAASVDLPVNPGDIHLVYAGDPVTLCLLTIKDAGRPDLAVTTDMDDVTCKRCETVAVLILETAACDDEAAVVDEPMALLPDEAHDLLPDLALVDLVRAYGDARALAGCVSGEGQRQATAEADAALAEVARRVDTLRRAAAAVGRGSGLDDVLAVVDAAGRRTGGRVPDKT